MGRDEPVMTLRGAAGAGDLRRIGRTAMAVGLIGLAVAVALLFFDGARRNDQLTRLHNDGVPVTAVVSSCRGLLGGSGSNPAGYACRGSYSLGGHQYSEVLPGNALIGPGTAVRLVAVPGDLGHLYTVGDAASAHPSWNVYILPTVLVVLLGVLTALARARLIASGRRAGYSGSAAGAPS
jgi:hypothetical protein